MDSYNSSLRVWATCQFLGEVQQHCTITSDAKPNTAHKWFREPKSLITSARGRISATWELNFRAHCIPAGVECNMWHVIPCLQPTLICLFFNNHHDYFISWLSKTTGEIWKAGLSILHFTTKTKQKQKTNKKNPPKHFKRVDVILHDHRTPPHGTSSVWPIKDAE